MKNRWKAVVDFFTPGDVNSRFSISAAAVGPEAGANASKCYALCFADLAIVVFWGFFGLKI